MYAASHLIPSENLAALQEKVKKLNSKISKARIDMGALQITFGPSVVVKKRSYNWVTFNYD